MCLLLFYVLLSSSTAVVPNINFLIAFKTRMNTFSFFRQVSMKDFHYYGQANLFKLTEELRPIFIFSI